MNLPDIRGVINVGKSLIMSNRPEILLGAAIAATGAAVVLAAKGGYDSGKQVATHEFENGEPLSKAEIVQVTWRNYVPAGLATVTALGATTGLHFIHVHEKKLLVASGLAAVEEVRKAAQDYIDDVESTVKDKVTGKKYDEITDEIEEKQFVRVFGSGDGILEPHYVLRDKHSGNDHWGNRNDVIAAVTELNRSIVDNGDADLNTFYNHAGWSDTDHGNEVGWNGGQRVTVRWSLCTRDDGTPVAQFQLEPAPKRDYDRSR